VNNELYKKLVDLYAGHELPAELEDQMDLAAFQDPELSHDMSTMRRTVDMLKNDPAPDFTEESHQRVLMKIYARGVEVQTRTQPPAHLQLHLPMQG
jgi:hypothetical protein